MKIAMLASGHKVLLDKKGNIFAPGILITNLANGLANLSHDVEVYAPKGSVVKAKLNSYDLEPMYSQYKELKETNPAFYVDTLYQYELFLASQVAENSKKYDLVHAHDYRKVMYFSRLINCPIVYTYHDSPTEEFQTQVDKKRFERFYKDNFFVAISKKQYELGKSFLNFIGVIHHGIDVENIPFSSKGSEEIIFSGRLMKKKRPDLAIKVAMKIDKKIRVAGEKFSFSKDIKYYHDELEPLLKTKSVVSHGLVPYDELYRYYGRSKVLLFPIEWEEPFGLVMIEAMACGTPVVAFNRGSVPEIVKDGVTGFIVPPNDINAMIKATRKMYEMPANEYFKMRQNCRKHVEDNFTVRKMVDGYEKVYQKVIDNYKKTHIS